MVQFAELVGLAEAHTSVKQLTLRPDQLETLVRLAINKVYLTFRLHLKHHQLIVSSNVIEYSLPSDAIKVIRFSDSSDTTITPNTKNSPILYTANNYLEIDSDVLQDEVFITYVATYTGEQDTDIVFSEQYIEPFSTYLNFIAHRMTGFKDASHYRQHKTEWEESIIELKENGLSYDLHSDHDDLFTTKGFR